jgi:FMN phosphatase YigB (HAD superfamily)
MTLMPELQPKSQCILFDWGDTLMRDFREFSGPMCTWPRVEALPYAPEALAQLHPRWILALATNAVDSDEKDIAQALQRADLARFIDHIYCYRSIGHKKPTPQYFDHVLSDLRLDRDQIVMVGDDFASDIAGANQSGIRAIWLCEQSDEQRDEQSIEQPFVQTIEQPIDDNYRIIRDFRELPGTVETFMAR